MVKLSSSSTIVVSLRSTTSHWIVTVPEKVTVPLMMTFCVVGTEDTFTVEAPDIEPIVALTEEEPTDTPVTLPELLTVAMDGAALTQVGEEQGLVEESENVDVQVREMAEPTLTEAGLGVTVIEVRVGELLVTVTVDVPDIDPIVADMTLLPTATPVTTPPLTVASDGVALAQAGDVQGAVEESEKVDVQLRVIVDPTATDAGFGDSVIETRVGADPPTLIFVTEEVEEPKSPSD